ncbi:putative ribosome-binding factor A, mitochondrial isoform X1 [Pteropus alecto]|uniref:putative ribosome-binding factor A, mitochondrial isoform X1 n=1 Tax=Pteropus alecto TaxID=9402 RepID=UPI0007689271|nr:putative ribosome-binding factor A, mitochondrial isoform X1 [Pteropus alecto]
MSVVAHRLGSLRAGFQALPGARHAGILGGARDLHCSPVSCGKNLLKKFAAKTKKKFWYEGPSLGPHLAFRFLPAAPSVSQYSLMPAVCLSCPETYKPSQLESLTKSTSQKTRKEDSVRLRALNGLLHKALTDLLCTPEVSQELCDLNVELSKVSLTADFSACRVYWKATPRAERDARAGAALRRSAAQMRHLLMSQQILRNVPPIVFVQDKEAAALAEVDRLLAVADFGLPGEEEAVPRNSRREPEAPGTPSPSDASGSAVPASLCGIDHEALSRQVAEYKRRTRKGRGGPAWPAREPAAELTDTEKRTKAAAHPAEDLPPHELPVRGSE